MSRSPSKRILIRSIAPGSPRCAPVDSRASPSACRACALTCSRCSIARTHRAAPSKRWPTRAAGGFEHINLDVIYGTPGESDDDWAATVDAVLATDVDHVSAYALTLEPGTRLTAQVRQGRVGALDEGALAARYDLLDERLSAAGFDWYELSNWARGEAAQCRHNLIYWRGHDWWGIGPGAHSHVAGRRWYNVAHPRDYAAARGPRRVTRGRAGRDPRRAVTAARAGDDPYPARRRLPHGPARAGRKSRRDAGDGRRITRARPRSGDH